jgi:CRISPR-associated exonuclease Cas4
LKEYTFCPRVLYYENCLPDLQPSTFKMQAGVMAHEREREKAARRTLKAYHLPAGERHFDVAVRDDDLGLTGEIDEVVVTESGVYIVDYKLAWKIGVNFKLQVAAYALLLESVWQTRAAGAVI